jgi:crossover junction endodeoxyribonuclease RuvC
MYRTSTPTCPSTRVRSNPPEIRLSQPRPLRILGVDPGSLLTGWGLVGGTLARPDLIDCGVIRTGSKTTELSERLAHLQREIQSVVERLDPDCAAVESPYHGVNARAALQLAHARGAILAVLGSLGVETAEYAPATVKKGVTGNGHAPKQQVRTMVFQLLRIRTLAGPADVTDALALALCHAALGRHRSLLRFLR